LISVKHLAAAVSGFGLSAGLYANAANHSTRVDGQTYTYDDNGNLLSDGTRIFILRQTQDRHTTPPTG
jgi:alpha-L-fucosidase